MGHRTVNEQGKPQGSRHIPYANTLILHVGAGKTATTAIQTAIPLLRKQLLLNRVRAPLDREVEPSFLYRPRPASGYSFTLAKLLNPQFRRGGSFDEDASWEWLETEIDEASKNQCNLLFSSEALQFPAKKQLRKLKSMITCKGWETRFVFYARTAMDYSISEYLQHLKTGFNAFPSNAYPKTLEDYITEATAPYAHTLSRYEETFGKSTLIVRNYDLEKTSLLQGFFHLISGADLTIPNLKQANRSLTRNEQEAFEKLMTLQNGKNICRLVGSVLSKRPQPPNHSRVYSISSTAVEHFMHRNADVVTKVNTYLPDCARISIITEHSPFDTSWEWSTPPDWHRLYSDIISIVSSDKLSSI